MVEVMIVDDDTPTATWMIAAVSFQLQSNILLCWQASATWWNNGTVKFKKFNNMLLLLLSLNKTYYGGIESKDC